jgi:EAL domain-containing protein (putative c-di-GMP-specific phosphodiesterase class I)
VLAEGVEDEGDMLLLQKLGCDQAQGYAIGRPKSAAEFARTFSRRIPRVHVEVSSAAA